MNRALASVGIAAALVCGSSAPALAADNPIDAKITNISSGSSQVSSPSAKPSPSETPIPSTRPTKTAETPKPSETKLAKTGSDSSFLVVLVPLVAVIGTFIYLISLSRKDDN